MEEITELKKTLPYFLQKVDDTIDETSTLREQLINSISKTVLEMDLKPNEDSARTTEVKLASLNTLSGLLNDKEKIRLNRAKLALQDKTNDIMENVGKDIATILPQIGLSTLLQGVVNKSTEETDLEIERVFEASGMTIVPAELEDDPTVI